MPFFGAAKLWDDFIFDIDHGTDPVLALNRLLEKDPVDLYRKTKWNSLPCRLILDGSWSAPKADADTGLPTFQGRKVTEIRATVQLPNNWVKGTPFIPHIHWMRETDSLASVYWDCRIKHAPAAGLFDTAWTELGVAALYTADDGHNMRHNVSIWLPVDTTDVGYSDLFVFQIIRQGNDDDYNGLAHLLDFDIYYQVNADGSNDLIE